MTATRKTENGVVYRIQHRPKPSITEGYVYWLGSDGSVLELTDDELIERDTSRGLSDE